MEKTELRVAGVSDLTGSTVPEMVKQIQVELHLEEWQAVAVVALICGAAVLIKLIGRRI